MKNAFTLNGQIPVYEWYLNNVVPKNTVTWTNEYINSFIGMFTPENIRNRKTDMYGSSPSKLHLQAFEKYIDSIKNKKIAVIGSQTPWIEAILVNYGAKEVTTVEYNVPICNHDIIKAISYTDFCNSSEKYDAIVSYSSIEHSGLGRYGDSLNPNGDIETMEQIYKSLNAGGHCFVGFPVGRDHLVWNAHRIYGPIRLKMMYLDKFKELEWFGCDKSYIYRCPRPIGNPLYSMQPIIILQKP
jgi:hypothetical protein